MFCALAAIWGCASASATTTYVPGGLADTDANSNGVTPLSVGSYYLDHGATPGGQYQQLYDGTEFAPLGGELEISQVAFRNSNEDSPDANSPTLGDIEVYMDTTSQTIDGISSNFAANENSPVLVYSGPITFNIPYDTGDPRCFCYTISFSTPYDYIPADGNLLVYIVILQGNNPDSSILPTLDYQRGDTTAFSVVSDFSSATDANGSSGTDQGLATQFTYDVVSSVAPEPSSAGLAIGGLLLLGLAGIRRRRPTR